jgi:hypothetical protein
MNKKELNRMKKEFKTDSVMLTIKDIYRAYVKKDSYSVIHSDLNYFELLDIEEKELYLNNFKKILGGTLDTKLFELQFIKENNGNEMQQMLDSMLKAEDEEFFIDCNNNIINKVLENYTYEFDAAITIIKGEYWSGKKPKKNDTYEEVEDYVHSLPFILGSVNKVEPFKKSLVFNYENKEFRPSGLLDTLINLSAPLDGFMFPCFENGYADVNKILYYNSKPKEINYKFIENVLSCAMKLTAEEEKACFTDIIKNAVGESVKPELIENIYSRLAEAKELSDEDEEVAVSINDIKNLLRDVETKDIEAIDRAFEDSCGIDYKFSINNIVPDYNSKSVKIWNDNISINMSPKNLNSVKQVRNAHGGRSLIIELDDDVVVEGFKLASEE